MSAALFRVEPQRYKQYTREQILHPDLSPSQIFCDGLFAVVDYDNALFLDIPLPIDGLITNGRQIDKQVGYAICDSKYHRLVRSTMWKWDKYQGAVHGFFKAEHDTDYTYVSDLRYFDLQEDFDLLRFQIAPELPESVVFELSGFTWEILDPTSTGDLYHTRDSDEAKALSHRVLQKYRELWLTNIDGQYITLTTNNTYTRISYGRRLEGDQHEDIVVAHDEQFLDNRSETAMSVGGLPEKIPLSYTVLREDAIKALHEFIETGQRPTCVRWRE